MANEQAEELGYVPAHTDDKYDKDGVLRHPGEQKKRAEARAAILSPEPDPEAVASLQGSTVAELHEMSGMTAENDQTLKDAASEPKTVDPSTLAPNINRAGDLAGQDEATARAARDAANTEAAGEYPDDYPAATVLNGLGIRYSKARKMSHADLVKLEGIGDGYATAIIEYNEKHK